jgi:hypothetical protein
MTDRLDPARERAQDRDEGSGGPQRHHPGLPRDLGQLGETRRRHATGALRTRRSAEGHAAGNHLPNGRDERSVLAEALGDLIADRRDDHPLLTGLVRSLSAPPRRSQE